MLDTNDTLLRWIPPSNKSFKRNESDPSSTQNSHLDGWKDNTMNSVEFKQDDGKSSSSVFPTISDKTTQEQWNQQTSYSQRLEINSKDTGNMKRFGYTDNGYVELAIGENCFKECKKLELTEWTMLKTIVIGKCCFSEACTSFKLTLCPCLEQLRVGEDSFKGASICLESDDESRC